MTLSGCLIRIIEPLSKAMLKGSKGAALIAFLMVGIRFIISA